MDLMTPEENEAFNDLERQSKVKQEIVKDSLWRKRQRLDEIDLLTNIVRDMAKRITELEKNMQLDTLPTPSPTKRVEEDDDTQGYVNT